MDNSDIFQNKITDRLLEKIRCYNIQPEKKKKKEKDNQDNQILSIGDIPPKRWGHISLNLNKKMIIHGGRDLYKSLSSIYSLDLDNLQWQKIEQEGSVFPAPRDSHSGVIYNNEIYIFGGNVQGKKVNDFWKFNFENKTWTKIQSSNQPTAVEGHSSCLVMGRYMYIQGGLNDSSVSGDCYIYDFQVSSWYEVSSQSKNDKYLYRECRSCDTYENIVYMFGGEADDLKYNDLYKVVISKVNSSFSSKWILEEPISQKPRERSGNSCVYYDPDLIFIVGGEGRDSNNNNISLNDIWFYSLINKNYYQIILNDTYFEERTLHSTVLIDKKIVFFGGMLDADHSLDTLTILALDGDLNINKKNKLKTMKNDIEYNQLLVSSRLMKNLQKGEHILITHSLSYLNSKRGLDGMGSSTSHNQMTVSKPQMTDKSVDTSDFDYDNTMNFDEMKKYFTNTFLSWKYLKDQCKYYQWPLKCVMNIIENSLKTSNNSTQVEVNLYLFNKANNEIDLKNSVFNIEMNVFKPEQSETTSIENKENLCLLIKDNGNGIEIDDFNEIISSIKTIHSEEETQKNLFKHNLTLKLSALRLGNSVCFLTKTQNSISISLISKTLQKKIDSEFIFSPILNMHINKEARSLNSKSKLIDDLIFERFVPQSYLHKQSLNLIFNEVKFMFKTKENFLSYLEQINNGTQIFIYDLRQISKSFKASNPKQILENYELFFDFHRKDIIFNQFFSIIQNENLVDVSLKSLLRHYFLSPPVNVCIYLLGSKVDMINPLITVRNVSEEKDIAEIQNLDISSSVKKIINKNSQNAIKINGIGNCQYNGIIFNKEYLLSLMKSEIFSGQFEKRHFLNGILIYLNGVLVSRYRQAFLGDYVYFLNETTQTNTVCNCVDDETCLCKYEIKSNIGYVELVNNTIQLLPNKADFSDGIVRGIVYSGIWNLISYMKK